MSKAKTKSSATTYVESKAIDVTTGKLKHPDAAIQANRELAEVIAKPTPVGKGKAPVIDETDLELEDEEMPTAKPMTARKPTAISASKGPTHAEIEVGEKLAAETTKVKAIKANASGNAAKAAKTTGTADANLVLAIASADETLTNPKLAKVSKHPKQDSRQQYNAEDGRIIKLYKNTKGVTVKVYGVNKTPMSDKHLVEIKRLPAIMLALFTQGFDKAMGLIQPE